MCQEQMQQKIIIQLLIVYCLTEELLLQHGDIPPNRTSLTHCLHQTASLIIVCRQTAKQIEQLLGQFKYQSGAVLQTVEEGFVFVGDAEAAAEIEYGVVVGKG